MGTGIMTFLTVIAVIAVTAVLFTGWIIVVIFRALRRGVYGMLGGSWRAGAQSPPDVVCQMPTCGAGNPAGARFCRRCGRPLV